MSTLVSIGDFSRMTFLSIKALRRTEEREEMESYLQRERAGARFSFEDILTDELRLDREEGERAGRSKEEVAKDKGE